MNILKEYFYLNGIIYGDSMTLKAEANSIERLAKERMEAEVRGKQAIHGGYGDVRLANRMEMKLAKIEKETWTIRGKMMNRFEVMAEVIELISTGGSLLDMSQISGMPSIRGIIAWRRHYPEFDENMKEAELCRGIILSEQAVNEALNSTDAKDAPAYKLKFEALWKMASTHNQKFQEKQVVEHKIDIGQESEDRLISKLAMIMDANPTLKKQLVDEGVIDAEIIDTLGSTPQEESTTAKEGEGPGPTTTQSERLRDYTGPAF